MLKYGEPTISRPPLMRLRAARMRFTFALIRSLSPIGRASAPWHGRTASDDVTLFVSM